jgi:preprotein translocase subunit SecF
MKVINFMGQRKIAAVFSAILLISSIGSLVANGLNWGLDFTGGTLVEVHYSETAPLNEIRTTLDQGGFAGAIVVSFGSDRDVLIRLPQGYSDKDGARLLEELQGAFSGSVDLRRIEFVGPQVGEELRDQGGLAMLLALGLVMLYVAFRFQFKFSMGAVIALAHDVLITLGFFSLTALEFDLTVLAALLAVIGYSLNDTIVVSDRIRENFRKIRKAEPIHVINVSLTETLARTLVTSFTTLLVLSALALFGGEMIFGFAVALLVGVMIGTYSSIYVAASSLLALGISKEDLIVPVREGDDQESLLP